jgi:hypothetical protein
MKVVQFCILDYNIAIISALDLAIISVQNRCLKLESSYIVNLVLEMGRRQKGTKRKGEDGDKGTQKKAGLYFSLSTSILATQKNVLSSALADCIQAPWLIAPACRHTRSGIS